MSIEVFNRYETKFLLDANQYRNIKKEISKYMRLDEYNKNKEFYTISNIYYDTKDSQLIRKSLARPVYKEKVRLRGYGIPSKNDKVFLEIKKKFNKVVNKRRTSLYVREAEKFLDSGKKPNIKAYMNEQVLNELEYAINLYNLEPKAYIAYDRRAYFGIDDPSFRLTIDTNIRTRRYDLTLYAGDYGEHLLEPDTYLMEVKTSGGIPLWLTKLLSENKVYKTHFSKYGTEFTKYINDEYGTIEEERKYA